MDGPEYHILAPNYSSSKWRRATSQKQIEDVAVNLSKSLYLYKGRRTIDNISRSLMISTLHPQAQTANIKLNQWRVTVTLS